MTHQTEFLGLQLGPKVISIGDDGKKLVPEWPKPKNLSELRGFITLLQFFRRVFKNF